MEILHSNENKTNRSYWFCKYVQHLNLMCASTAMCFHSILCHSKHIGANLEQPQITTNSEITIYFGRMSWVCTAKKNNNSSCRVCVLLSFFKEPCVVPFVLMLQLDVWLKLRRLLSRERDLRGRECLARTLACSRRRRSWKRGSRPWRWLERVFMARFSERGINWRRTALH